VEQCTRGRYIRARITSHGQDILQCIHSASDVSSGVSEFGYLLTEITSDYCSKTERVKKCVCGNIAESTTPASQRNKLWFDQDCQNLYHAYKGALKTFNTNKTNYNRVTLAEFKKAYKMCAARSKRRFLRQEGNVLTTLKRINPKEFYKLFKRKRNKNTRCPLSTDNFREYFGNIMRTLIHGKIQIHTMIASSRNLTPTSRKTQF
jgi:hypothetical protein